ncbi:serine/threonine protein kinase [Sporosarcina ureilytica]|uniref:Serine/threonine protein kinase n=1 Tax=Sporosarcina ureilytica TaxID=298596 RepID=A0A1D8JE32_9BACL|nr:serine/threonine protein kinase [Sporosarcina ureilytica]AOV06970.1 serine/threonine protein kinase [Sporosarcina ureilytica]
MNIYQALARTVAVDRKNRLIRHGNSLKLVGKGRSAFVFRIKSSNKVIKIFFPEFAHIAKEEMAIYRLLQNIPYYPTIYDAGANYIVIDYIEGLTLFECVAKGKIITPLHMKEIDYALELATEQGLNPSDIHLRNIFITKDGDIKIIDVARYRQQKTCVQWQHFKRAYEQLYRKQFFPKKIATSYLNGIAFLYKKGIIPTYRTN